jgi:hypothetical protein
MKKILIISITVIIILLIVIDFFFFEKLRIKHLINANQQLLSSVDYTKRIGKLKQDREKIIIRIKETIVTIENKTIADALQKEIDRLINNCDEVEKIKDDRIKQLETQLIKSTDMLKKVNRKFGISGIASIGLDQELNLNASEGLILKGMFLNNRMSFGGGGGCNQRKSFDNPNTIIGGFAALELAIYF